MQPSNRQLRVLGQTVDDDTLRADLEKYVKIALELGASGATVVPVCEIVVDERVRLKCAVPRCNHLGATPNCPPYAPDLDLVRKALQRYLFSILFKCDVGPAEDYMPRPAPTDEQRMRALSFHAQSARLAGELERQAFKDGYHLSMALGGGSCKDYLCHGEPCQYLETGRCRFPYQARPSMEAMGIDVMRLICWAGWEAFAYVGEVQEPPTPVTVGILFVC